MGGKYSAIYGFLLVVLFHIFSPHGGGKIFPLMVGGKYIVISGVSIWATNFPPIRGENRTFGSNLVGKLDFWGQFEQKIENLGVFGWIMAFTIAVLTENLDI